MNKNKSVKSNLSLTSHKGSLIAQINNLRKQLKQHKQSKKQITVLSQKPIKDILFGMNKKEIEKKCVTSMSSTTKDRFFKSSKQEFTSPSKIKTSNLAFETQKSYYQYDRTDKKCIKQNKQTIQQQKEQRQIYINEIWLKQKDRKLKMDIQINKLRKIIKKQGPQQISQQVNYIINLLNYSLHQYTNRIQLLEKNQKEDNSDQYLLIKRQQQEIQLQTNKIIQLEEEIRNIKLQLKHKQDKQLQLLSSNQLITQEKEQLKIKSQTLQNILKQLQEKSITLQEQNKILQSKLLKKQQSILLINQDINYLNLQTQNYKSQKKEFQQLYQNTLAQFKQFKRTKNLQIQKLIQEKQKWQKQCQQRRNQSQQINALQQQKITLIKQLTEMRHLCNLKTQQLNDKKSLMHQNQKKVIQLQSQVYKLRSEIQTITNKYQFSQFQNQRIKEEFQDLKKYAKRNHSKQKKYSVQKSNSKQKTVLKQLTKVQNEEQTLLNCQNKLLTRSQQNIQHEEEDEYINENEQKRQVYNKKLKQKEQKLKTLQDIHSLIKKHRQQMQI